MPADGVLTTIDVEVENQRAAREAFAEEGMRTNRARLISGRALDVLPRLTDGAYDLVLLDADKTEYAPTWSRRCGCCVPAGCWRSTTRCGTTGSPTRRSGTR